MLASEELQPGIQRVTRLCTVPVTHRHAQFEFFTYEVTAFYWRSAKFDIEKKVRGQGYRTFLSERDKLAATMRRERAKGADCVALAAKYKMSVHMVRYYTKIPRKPRGTSPAV